jgi:Protein of unknown function (DUF1573)
MSRLRLCGIIFLILHLMLSGSLITAQEKPGPRLVLEERVHDFGKVEKDAVIEHAFRVLNQGDQELKIVRVKPG